MAAWDVVRALVLDVMTVAPANIVLFDPLLTFSCHVLFTSVTDDDVIVVNVVVVDISIS